MPSEAKPPSEHSGPGRIVRGEDVPPRVYGPSEHSESRPIKDDGPQPLRIPEPKRKVPKPTSGEREAKPEVPRVTQDLVLELIGLVGGKKSGLLIPADSSEPVTETEFDPDKLWQYNIEIYDRDKVFLTKKNAELYHDFPNSLATDYVKQRSDAAKDDPDTRLTPPKELYGPVYVLGYDPVLEIITGLQGQLDQLKHSLEWMAPFRKSG